MVEEDRSCADVLVQIASVRQALRAASQSLMRSHLRHCATVAIRHGSPRRVEAMFSELIELTYKYSR